MIEKNRELTQFQKNERAAADRFQEQMDRYGLKVDRSSSGGRYADECMEFFNVYLATVPMPAKGNKKLIEQLKNDGFCVFKWLDTIPGHVRQYVFRVVKGATITTGRADRIGHDLVELERKLFGGERVCISDLDERQLKHIRKTFEGRLAHTCELGLEYVALNREVVE